MEPTDSTNLRKRKGKTEEIDHISKEKLFAKESASAPKDATEVTKIETGTCWLTRIVLIRYIGFIYCMFYFLLYLLCFKFPTKSTSYMC